MVAVALLAAGRGTRMKSNLPKVLHPVGGRSIIERVLDSVDNLPLERRLIVVGFAADQVKASLSYDAGLEFVEQLEQLGTGHAVQQLLPALHDYDGDLLVLNGDVPLLRPETLETLVNAHQEANNEATLLTAHLPDPTGYGRVFCDANNGVKEIVEHRDCNEAQRQNTRINAGVYCFRWSSLAQILPTLSNDNDQQEYYLTDVARFMNRVQAVDVEDYQEILGVNDRIQLSTAYDILQTRIKEGWMRAGVTLVDPASITIDSEVVLEPDVIIEPQTHLRGRSHISSGCRIGPSSLIEDSNLGEDVTVSFSVISDSVIQTGSRVGPYAHLRGQAQVGAGCRIGNFVELKKAQLGDRTNVAHLSYLGDAQLGEKVNVGAGTITANYDGYQKHRTVIGDRTKTGSNCVLVAPLTVGADVTIAAGSTITEDVPDHTLAIARSRQTNKPGWKLKSASPQSAS